MKTAEHERQITDNMLGIVACHLEAACGRIAEARSMDDYASGEFFTAIRSAIASTIIAADRIREAKHHAENCVFSFEPLDKRLSPVIMTGQVRYETQV